MRNGWNNPRHITLPVKRVDGEWELLYGGDTGVADGTYGELRVALNAIADDRIKERLTQMVAVKVLDEGATLAVALSDHSKPRPPVQFPLSEVANLPAGCSCFALVTIGQRSTRSDGIDAKRGGLWIRQRGVDKTELVCSSIMLPDGLEAESARSLNHACTLLSEHYETHRISHTMNVYQRVFYSEPGNSPFKWFPLGDLRDGVIQQAEQTLVRKAWSELEQQLGFRPISRKPGGDR